jgi:hypothetical protein
MGETVYYFWWSIDYFDKLLADGIKMVLYRFIARNLYGM